LEDQFLKILSGSKNTIHRVCNGFANSPGDAEDLFQEVLLQIWKSLPGFRGASSQNTWVYRIALNVCLQEQHRHAKRTKAIQARQREETLSVLPGQDEQYEQLYTCIRRLNSTDKGLIMLYLEDMSYKEIGEITALSENHIAVKIMRIKQKLFTCIKQLP
jgi:RNA polymerase sigma factor (sigma-70 family)